MNDYKEEIERQWEQLKKTMPMLDELHKDIFGFAFCSGAMFVLEQNMKEKIEEIKKKK